MSTETTETPKMTPAEIQAAGKAIAHREIAAKDAELTRLEGMLSDPNAVAESRWASNHEGIRAEFTSKENYVAWFVGEVNGMVHRTFGAGHRQG